ncbi:MAG: sodium:calcium antiporter [Euryarchaeota archaeon]|nr:sodium:calcium antiporter [Euryarchaeota archaeon]
MFIDILIFLLLLGVLVISGILTTKTLSNISSYLKLGHFTAGFIIMALATGIPELMVGFNSALAGLPVLSLGDVLGSNIINLSLVIGLAVLISGAVTLKESTIKNEIIYLFIISLLPLLLALDQHLSRMDGFILISAFIFYFLAVFRKTVPEEDEEEIGRKLFIKSSFLFVLSVVFLVFSARFLVYYAALIASEIGVPLFIVGILLLSFGTSLPELTFETIAMLHGYKIMAVGDLMGSTIANSTLVLGVVAIISPIMIIDFTLFKVTSAFFIILLFFVILFLLSYKGITRARALILIITYLTFLIVLEAAQLY